MLNDERNINMVDEMLGIIPGQTRSYVSSATGSISMGGTPLCPQQQPIHTANSLTGVTSGTLSPAAKTILTATTAGTGLTASTASATFTIGTGTPPIGSVVLNSSGAYVGTVLTTTPSYTFTANAAVNETSAAYTYASNIATGLTTSTGSRSFSVVSGAPAAGDAVYDMSAPATPVYIGTVLTTSPYTFVNYASTAKSLVAYAFIPSASKSNVAYTYDVSLPTDSIPSPNVSYTIQAGDDFEQEVMKYGKCMGFSMSGGSGGAIDMSSNYMGQAVQLGYLGEGLITTSTANANVSGLGTTFIDTISSSDVGRKLYTLDNVLIGTIESVTNATAVVLNANATVTLTASEYRLGGFTKNTGIASPTDDLIFARSRLFIDNEQAWPVARPTPVIYQFLAFSTSLQCQWTAKFTGEGYQGIDPTWAFALLTNYQFGGDFTVEHDVIASSKYSASSVESLKYAWRKRIPKIIQVDIPSASAINWFTVSAAPSAKTLSYTYPATPDAGTISIDAAAPTVVTGVDTNFVGSAGKALCVKVGSTYYYVGKILASPTPSAFAVTLDGNAYGAIPAGSAFALDATKVTGGATSFTVGTTDVNKDLFQNATTWIGRIAAVDSTTVAHTYASSAIGTFSIGASPGFIMDSCTTQPYFPVVGKGPLQSYTGISIRVPIIINNVSSINDNDGNDIVTVSWQQRYNTVVGNYGGDIRIVNQIPSLSVAN